MRRAALCIAGLALIFAGSVQANTVSGVAASNPELARSLYRQAIMNQRRGHYEQAEAQHLQTLQIREETLPADPGHR